MMSYCHPVHMIGFVILSWITRFSI
jgi:hypothetical protein